MCITEIWAYQECGCQYLHPIFCYDRVLQLSHKSYRQSEDWFPVAPGSSSSSVPSIDNRDAQHEGQYLRKIRSSHDGDLDHVEDVETNYNHRLHLARTCSLRRMAQKTFLEPVCDDCLLHELGLVAGGRPVYSTTKSDYSRHEDGVLDAAEWLLESNVEIIVESPVDDASVCSKPFQMTNSRPPSPRGTEDEAPQQRGRGRGRRRASEIGQKSLVTPDTSSIKSQSSFNRVKRAGRQLRRAQKQDNLKVSTDVCSTSSKSSKTKPLSWIEHLKSDLRRRIRKKRPDVGLDMVPLQRNESANDISSTNAPDEALNDADDEEVEDELAGGDQGDTILSIPATASSAYSTTSARLEERIISPFNQLIVSSEFEPDSSDGTDQHRLGIAIQRLQSDRRSPVLISPAPSAPLPIFPSPGPDHQPQPSQSNPLGSAARPTSLLHLERSFHTATSTVSPLPGQSEIVDAVYDHQAGAGEKISQHPLSCPFRARPTCGSTRTFSAGQGQKDDFVQGDVRGAWKEGEVGCEGGVGRVV